MSGFHTTGSPVSSLDLSRRRDQMRKMVTGILGERCYIVFASEIGMQCHGNLGGLTAVGLSALIRESNPEQYVGPLPAIAVVDDDLRCGKFSSEDSAMVLDAVITHEAAHIVANDVTSAVCPDVDNQSLREVVQAPWWEWKAHSGPHKWAGHDFRFIRALCHLHHRMQSRGHWVSLNLAFNHEAYGLSPAEQYAEALGGECERLSWRPLREALGGPMPAEFQKLWQDDVVRSLSLVPVERKLKC
jgi:hypothetical protein